MAFTGFFDELAPFPATLLPRVRDLGLAGKILLGTDFPNIPYPYAEQLAALTRLDLGDDWLRRGLLGQPRPPASARPTWPPRGKGPGDASRVGRSSRFTLRAEG